MNKPNNYDSTQISGGDFIPVELGGHTAVIKNVLETVSRSNKPMIVVQIDFDAEDTQTRYFAKAYEEDDRPEKKWPYQATQYIVTEDNNWNCTRSFKGFCTAFENSNKVKINWDANNNWADQFTGKKIGVVFGEVEEEYNGEVKTRRRIRWFCDHDGAVSQKIPNKKMLTTTNSTPATDDNGFMVLPDDGEEVPW